MSTDSVLGAWRRVISAADHAAVHQHYAADALFDVNLPHGRFQLRGPTAIQAQLDEWHPQAPDVVEWSQRTTAWGAVVELALWEGDHYELYSRSIHVLDIDSGAITRHVMYCTGDWTREQLRQATRPLVQPGPQGRSPVSARPS